MSKDPNTERQNERMRQEKIADQEAGIKKHGDHMGKIVRGEYATGDKSSSGCIVLFAMLAGAPLAYMVADRLV